MGVKGLRNTAVVVFVLSMSALLLGGYFAREKVPPIPEKIVTGETLLSDGNTILRGQDVYQRYGLMDHGSVWGHGTLRGMDFSADTLHKMGQYMRDFLAITGDYAELPAERQRAIDTEVIYQIHVNRYDPQTKTLELTPAQVYALEQIRVYWKNEFSEGDPHYGFLKDTITAPDERKDLADFFFWTAWAASANRPGHSYSYTNNWPSDRSVGNTASTEALSGASARYFPYSPFWE